MRHRGTHFGNHNTLTTPSESYTMNKLLTALVFSALASLGFSAHAASHAAGAPMKADAAKPAASAAKAHKAHKAASGAKADMKKDEAKK